MKKFLFYFAVTGWTLGLIVHLLSIADYNVSDKVPFVWLLHFGIFVVWLPGVFILIKNEGLNVFRQTPRCLTMIALAGFFYAILNFVLVMTISHFGVPDIKNGQFILHDHGKLIKTLTEQEYHHYKVNDVRGFSGHWLAFYGLAAAILFPFDKQK